MIVARAITMSRLFRVDGLDLGSRWSEVDPSNPDTRKSLLTYSGTHCQVRDDAGELGAHGLALEHGRVVELPAAAPPDGGDGDGEGDGDGTEDDENEGDTKPAARRGGRGRRT